LGSVVLAGKDILVGTSVSAEMTLPDTPEDVETWLKVSYTPRKYIEAWQKVLQVFRADFPNQYISLIVGSGLNINDQGKVDPRERARTRKEVIDPAIGLLGRRLYSRTAISMQARISTPSLIL
jgi:hypothetical protein